MFSDVLAQIIDDQSLTVDAQPATVIRQRGSFVG
jgi:hypothetical protein